MTLVNVSELMSDPDFVEQVQITRTQGAFDATGVWHNIGPKTIVWQAMAIEQSTPSQLLALPEGEREGSFITCWSFNPLIAADGISGQASDVILFHGAPYRVVRVADRSDNGFFQAIAQFSPISGGIES